MNTQLELFKERTIKVAVIGKRNSDRKITYKRVDNMKEIDPFIYGHDLRAVNPDEEQYGKSDWTGFVYIPEGKFNA